MTKDVKVENKPVDLKNVEAAPATPAAPVPLDATVMAAIQATVQAAMKEAVGIIVEQLKPDTLPKTPAPSIPVVNAGAPRASSHFDKNGNYVSKLKGIPVEEGQDLRDVNPNVIRNWFSSIENRWKEQMNARKIGGTPVEMGWTRG